MNRISSIFFFQKNVNMLYSELQTEEQTVLFPVDVLLVGLEVVNTKKKA